MNPNLTVDNDLQKAIDDITNNTNSDPVFADTVAAPAPIAPAPAAPAPMPQAAVVEPTPAPAPVVIPEPVAPLDPIPAPESVAPLAPELAPEPAIEAPSFGAPAPVMPAATEEMSATVVEEAPVEEISSTPTDINDIKAAALNDLTPLLSEIVPRLKDANIKPSTKFKLYEKIITELGDQSAIGSAYETANQIGDDKERSEALLSLVEVIDQM